jgi:hypothetical protein
VPYSGQNSTARWRDEQVCGSSIEKTIHAGNEGTILVCDYWTVLAIAPRDAEGRMFMIRDKRLPLNRPQCIQKFKEVASLISRSGCIIQADIVDI